MIRNRMTLAVAAALIGTVALVGCKKKEEPAATTPPPAATTPAPAPAPAAPAIAVTSVEVGSAIGADGKVTNPGTSFGTRDTIYASVATDGTASGNVLAARFSFQDGQEVFSDSRTLTTSGPAVTEFHASKADGWPVGRYKVEVSLDGAVVQTREYEIR